MRSATRGLGTTAAVLAAVMLCSWQAVAAAAEPTMSDERAVFQTKWGDIHFGFYPEVRQLMQIMDMPAGQAGQSSSSTAPCAAGNVQLCWA
jgi:hypothetical protein